MDVHFSILKDSMVFTHVKMKIDAHLALTISDTGHQLFKLFEHQRTFKL